MNSILIIITLATAWALCTAYNSWNYFKPYNKLNEYNYPEFEYNYGKPSVVMEGKFIAWDKKIWPMKTIILISHSKKMKGATEHLMIEKSLNLEIGKTPIKIYKE
jgi:hypothetical protein